MKKLVIALALVLGCASGAWGAWNGFDWEKRCYVDVEADSLVRVGETIVIFDWGKVQYEYVQVLDITRYGNFSVELIVYNPITGETRVLDMDGSQH